MLVAHTPGPSGEWHALTDHLHAVAETAAAHAARFGGEQLAWWAGLLHDIGKASPEFQHYLALCDREPNRRHATVDHKGAGALLAFDLCEELAFLVQGHHGGLPNRSALRTKLKELRHDPAIQATVSLGPQLGWLPTGRTMPPSVSIPEFVDTPYRLELLLRLLFAALVDGDHRDTERHFTPERARVRERTIPLATLGTRLAAAQEKLSGRKAGPVNQVRDRVYRACLDAATAPPGFFRLTVPTGGGKTRSGLAFALQHALTHGLDRVIVAVPYLTITDQTATVYREILGDDGAVLEHHSGVREPEDSEGGQTPAALWRRLTAQDWDAPVIVTTMVQLFESLFGNRTTGCRKLCRIPRSVIILDEAQTLPSPLLAPILDVLHELTLHYGVTVVLSTATQPAFEHAPGFAELADVRELAPDPPRLFRELRRVAYEWPLLNEAWDWDKVAEELSRQPQSLTIVNTKADALALLDALSDPGALHLSTLLCGAHRRAVLDDIRSRLGRSLPCHVISTQVVEAGVDIDFPLVLRALGPLDRIVQAAGRCNREGHLEVGRVVVFRPREGGLPPGPYTTATQTTETLLAGRSPELDDPGIFDAYFHQLFGSLTLDRDGIQALRARLEFEEVAKRFRMIEDDTISVVVRYRAAPGDTRAEELIKDLRSLADSRAYGRIRDLLRKAQPFLVSIRRSALDAATGDGLISPLVGDLWLWEGRYDDVRGLTWTGRHAAELVI